MQPLAKNVDLQVLCANYGTHDYDVKTIAKKLLEVSQKFTIESSSIIPHRFVGN